MALELNWNHGLLWRHPRTGRFVQIILGKGGAGQRVIWWPRFGQVSIRIVGYWWLSLNWTIERPTEN